LRPKQQLCGACASRNGRRILRGRRSSSYSPAAHAIGKPRSSLRWISWQTRRLATCICTHWCSLRCVRSGSGGKRGMHRLRLLSTAFDVGRQCTLVQRIPVPGVAPTSGARKPAAPCIGRFAATCEKRHIVIVCFALTIRSAAMAWRDCGRVRCTIARRLACADSATLAWGEDGEWLRRNRRGCVPGEIIILVDIRGCCVRLRL
jgi:hypothetical protein